jgi:hypothetical protein
MKKIGLMLGILLAVLTHAATAEEAQGQRIARACARDVAVLTKPSCQVPSPRIEDFQHGGIIYNCLSMHLGSGQLSKPCHDVMMGGR